MKLELDFPRTAALARPRCNVRPAPSLRVPATPDNRELLRWLRAAELSAWQEADAKPARSFRIRVSRFSCPPLFQLNINLL